VLSSPLTCRSSGPLLPLIAAPTAPLASLFNIRDMATWHDVAAGQQDQRADDDTAARLIFWQRPNDVQRFSAFPRRRVALHDATSKFSPLAFPSLSGDCSANTSNLGRMLPRPVSLCRPYVAHRRPVARPAGASHTAAAQREQIRQRQRAFGEERSEQAAHDRSLIQRLLAEQLDDRRRDQIAKLDARKRNAFLQAQAFDKAMRDADHWAAFGPFRCRKPRSA